MRVPHEPQKAKFAWTSLPQLGQGISADAGTAAGGVTGSERNRGAEAAWAPARTGPGVGAFDNGAEGLGAGVAAGIPPSGFGGSWNEAGGAKGAGIFGESFQGIPLLGLVG